LDFRELRAGIKNSAARASSGICVAHPPSFRLLLISGTRGTNMSAPLTHDDALQRVRGEYHEMPGLRLTTAQAQRLWGLDRKACAALLDALVDAKFLFRTRDGAFMRSDQARASRT